MKSTIVDIDKLSCDRIDRMMVLYHQIKSYYNRLDTLEEKIDAQTNREKRRIIYSPTQPSSDSQSVGDFWKEIY